MKPKKLYKRFKKQLYSNVNTLKIITVFMALILIGIAAKASDTDSLSSYQYVQTIKNEIGEQIKYPKAARLNLLEGFVNAQFDVDEMGNIKVLDISGHPSFIASVKLQLESLKVSPLMGVPTKELIMKFNFNIVEN